MSNGVDNGPGAAFAAMNRNNARKLLLDWYERHARSLPWRAPPGAPRPDPYRVWLSEIMLQQTTVAAVTPRFDTFVARWQKIEALAAADDADVMAAWAGLGYYARARNLIACARAIVADHGGQFPETAEELRTLPGIGAYTSAAIAAIAFGRPEAPIDANVERVTARLFAIDAPLPGSRAQIDAEARGLYPASNAGDFAQALMDLGSTICTARNPACPICPLLPECDGAARGEPAAFPVKPAKKAKPRRYGAAWWIEHAGEILLVRRPPRGMLGGMRALPSCDWSTKRGTATAPIGADFAALGNVTHSFTHFDLSLDLFGVALLTRPVMDGEWWPIDGLDAAGLPTLFAKAASLALAQSAAQGEIV